MIRRSNGDRIHILPRQRIAEVLISSGGIPQHSLRGQRKLLHDRRINIADAGNARVDIICMKRREMRIGSPIETNHREVDAIVCTEDLAIALSRGTNHQSRRAQCNCVDKLSPIDHLNRPYALLVGTESSSTLRRHRSTVDAGLGQCLLQTSHTDARRGLRCSSAAPMRLKAHSIVIAISP